MTGLHRSVKDILFLNFYRLYFTELEARQMIGLFPQIKRDPELNPWGCWNFFGYLPGNDTSEYYTKDGIQTRILRRMLYQLSGKNSKDKQAMKNSINLLYSSK